MRTTVSCDFTLMVVMAVMLLAAPVWAKNDIEENTGSDNDITYTSDIKALFDNKCAGCHGDGAPEHKQFKKDKEGYKAQGLGPRINSYTHLLSFVGWPDTGALMRRLDDGRSHKGGKPGNMYQYLGNSDAERQTNLQIFRTWVGNWSVKRWKTTSKEEINAMTVKY